MNTIVMSVLTGIVVVLYIGRMLGDRYYRKKLEICVEQGDPDTFEALAKSRALHMMVSPYTLQDMRRGVVLKAFHNSVQNREQETARELLVEIRKFDNPEIVEECNMLFDIYILKKSSYIDKMLKEMEELPVARQALNEYLISLQYQNRGDAAKAEFHEARSAELVQKTLDAQNTHNL